MLARITVALLLFGALFAGLVVVSESGLSRVHQAAPQEQTGAEFVFEAHKQLVKNFYAPAELKAPKLFNAGLEGIEKLLKSKGVDFTAYRIAEDESDEDARLQFGGEFSRAARIAKEKEAQLEQHAFAFTATEGMLESVGDSHTGFFPPKQWAEEKKQRSGEVVFAGIGVRIKKLEDNLFYFDAVFPEGPAAKAGVERFDRLTAVDGQPAGNDLVKIVERIRGEKGKEVELEIARKGEPRKFKFKRDDISMPSTDMRVVKVGDDAFGHLTVYSFLPLHVTLETLRHVTVTGGEKKLKGFVIDLRGNGGGYIHILKRMLGIFLEADTECYTLKCASGDEPYKVFIGPVTRKPVVVLVDDGSASASEIFSGVLQEQKRAKVVGKKTAGAVSVAKTVELPHDAAMGVTVCQFFTAAGKKLEKEGVTPDVVVELTKDDILNGRDAQLNKAIEILKKESENR